MNKCVHGYRFRASDGRPSECLICVREDRDDLLIQIENIARDAKEYRFCSGENGNKKEFHKSGESCPAEIEVNAALSACREASNAMGEINRIKHLPAVETTLNEYARRIKRWGKEDSTPGPLIEAEDEIIRQIILACPFRLGQTRPL